MRCFGMSNDNKVAVRVFNMLQDFIPSLSSPPTGPRGYNWLKLRFFHLDTKKCWGIVFHEIKTFFCFLNLDTVTLLRRIFSIEFEFFCQK